MIQVYFERKGFARHIATFYTNEAFEQCQQILLKLATDQKFDMVTKQERGI